MPRRVLAIVAVVSLALIAIALIWSASEAHYRGCVAQVNTRYPAVPVSAYLGDRTAVGPLKLSFFRERRKALQDCHHF